MTHTVDGLCDLMSKPTSNQSNAQDDIGRGDDNGDGNDDDNDDDVGVSFVIDRSASYVA